MKSTAIALAACALAGLAPALPAQLADLQPGRNFTSTSMFGPGGQSQTESGDFGDVDLDGDLDCVTANGGDGSVAQIARIFINNGFGTFADETTTRFAGLPAMQSRDIEFADIENDGDLDVFVANKHAGGTAVGEVSRFFVNLGGVQTGAVGFYQDETVRSWGTLSSVLVVDQVCGGCNSGPFRDWSCDCDFGDFDDDGYLDLFFSSYGPAFNGSRPSRIFLNDGLGVFDELFPWCAGVQSSTMDIQTHAVDLDLADFDGDFDLDVFVSSRNTQSRVYLNNLFNPISASPFNDITQVALINQGAVLTGAVTYEGEYGDVDGDGDFDVWMVNYNNNLDRILRNDGIVAGGVKFTQVNTWIANDPVVDDNEVDFGDYDNDGDLDAFMANFSGTDFLYQSNLAQGGQGGGIYHRTGLSVGQAPNGELPSPQPNQSTTLDGEWADMDNDGDLDIAVFNDANQGNYLWRNVLGVPDTHAPGFYQVTVQADKPNGTPTVIHAQIRDNGPGEWLTNFFDWDLVYSVDGGAPISVSMVGQSGSQGRGVIPAQADASIDYHVEVTDLAGNTGVSASRSFVQGTLVLDPWTDLGSGLAGIGGIPALAGTGPLATGSAGTLALTNAAPSAMCALFVSLSSTPTPFKCGTLVPLPVALQVPLLTNGSGAIPLAWASWPAGLSGASLYFQYAIADGAAVCGASLSNAIRGDVP